MLASFLSNPSLNITNYLQQLFYPPGLDFGIFQILIHNSNVAHFSERFGICFPIKVDMNPFDSEAIFQPLVDGRAGMPFGAQ